MLANPPPPWQTCSVSDGFLPDFRWWAFFVEGPALLQYITASSPEPDEAFFRTWRNYKGTVFYANTFNELAADLNAFVNEKFSTQIANCDFDKAASWVIVSSAAFGHKFLRIRYSSANNPGYPFLEEKHNSSVPSPAVLVAIIRGNTLHAGFVRAVADPRCNIPFEVLEERRPSKLPQVTRSIAVKHPRQFNHQALNTLRGVNLRDYPVRACIAPQPPEFPSPPRGSIITTANCLRKVACIYACNFSFRTSHFHFRLSRSSDDVLCMKPVESSVDLVKDRHQYHGLGEKFEAAVTSQGDVIYSYNTLDLGDGVTVCYTAQQDAIDEARLVEVKTLQQPRNKQMKHLPLPMHIACFLRKVDTLCLGLCDGDILYDIRIISPMELQSRDVQNQLPSVISFLCKTLMRLRKESLNWAQGDEYDLLYTCPDLGFILRRRDKEEDEPTN